MRRNLFEVIWDRHLIRRLDMENDLLAIDRLFLHDLCGTFAFQLLNKSDHEVYDPSRVFATPDHTLASRIGRTIEDSEMSRLMIPAFREGCKRNHIKIFDIGSKHQGIVHIIGPESGLTIPGITILCGDSHTCTHGALGALAIGAGTNQVYHALASSCHIAKRPKTMEICIEGECNSEIDAMDIALYILSQHGNAFATEYAIEYTGSVIRNMEIEDRLTLCNLTAEMGARYCIVAPDEKTIKYLNKKYYAPDSKILRQYVSDLMMEIEFDEAHYDMSIRIDAGDITRQVSWGINPSHTIPIDAEIPNICDVEVYEYMGLKYGRKIAGTRVDRVFIGSCANGSILSIEKAAAVAQGKKVNKDVVAMIVPGSEMVEEEAKKRGLMDILTEAGFLWGEPCCSLCVGSNGEVIPAGQRCISTTNRNFIGRQGKGARTHLASIKTAVMSAVNGYIC